MGSKGERAADYINVEEAKALLAEAGYAEGFDVDMTVCDLDMEGVLLSDLAQKVKGRSGTDRYQCKYRSAALGSRLRRRLP